MRKYEQVSYISDAGQNFEFICNTVNAGSPAGARKNLQFKITKDNSYFILSSPEEIDEFCELLQEKKKEIWK